MFDKFPTPEEFADRVIVTPVEAEIVLRYISNMAGTAYGVSVDAASIAGFAINNGMDYRKVAAVFASDYPECIRRSDGLGVEIADPHRPQGGLNSMADAVQTSYTKETYLEGMQVIASFAEQGYQVVGFDTVVDPDTKQPTWYVLMVKQSKPTTNVFLGSTNYPALLNAVGSIFP